MTCTWPMFLRKQFELLFAKTAIYTVRPPSSSRFASRMRKLVRRPERSRVAERTQRRVVAEAHGGHGVEEVREGRRVRLRSCARYGAGQTAEQPPTGSWKWVEQGGVLYHRGICENIHV